jgi:hypothetical protein
MYEQTPDPFRGNQQHVAGYIGRGSLVTPPAYGHVSPTVKTEAGSCCEMLATCQLTRGAMQGQHTE